MGIEFKTRQKSIKTLTLSVTQEIAHKYSTFLKQRGVIETKGSVPILYQNYWWEGVVKGNDWTPELGG